MIRITVLLFLILFLAAPAGVTQHHTAGCSFIHDANAATNHPVAVGRLSSSGKLTTILPFSKRLNYDHAHGGSLDVLDVSPLPALKGLRVWIQTATLWPPEGPWGSGRLRIR